MILSIIKYGIFAVLALFGVTQTYLYRKIKREWSTYPVVAGTVIESRLFDQTDSGGTRTYEALIKFKYDFKGKEYESETPALRGPQLFPQYEFELSLLDKYKEGEMYNVKVHPEVPTVAYLEIEPLSKKSMIFLPLIIIGYLIYFTGIATYMAHRMANVF